MRLIVGLGNPGQKYEGTRHNVGFWVLRELARRYASAKPKVKFQGEVLETNIAGVSTLMLCPHTFMNRSGTSVRAAFDFYKMDAADVLVICDDFNLPLGKLRFRAKGSAGGQKGLADTIRCLGTEKFGRLRIGIGEPRPNQDVAAFVLSRFAKNDRDEIDLAVQRGADGVVDWARSGIEYSMNQYN